MWPSDCALFSNLAHKPSVRNFAALFLSKSKATFNFLATKLLSEHGADILLQIRHMATFTQGGD